MIAALRQAYNEQFTEEKYRQYLQGLENIFPGQLDFRVAETPVFVTREFTEKMLSACDSILDVANTDAYKAASERAIPAKLRVPNEDEQPQFLAFDFGVCTGAGGEPEPQLIEMQAFPSLFAWHTLLPEVHRQVFGWPENFSPYLSGLNAESYIQLLREIIVGDENPENVILLEIFPEKQKTRVDFFATEKLLGIKTVCLTALESEGRDVFYKLSGKRTQVRRIYNRVIFDELLQQTPDVQEKGKIFQQELNVKWLPHPNWFYRISKFTLPFIHHSNVPQTFFLNEVNALPPDLENYVAKPLFSFAGQGVIIDVTKEDLEKIEDPENWILQKKVNYAPAIETPNEPAKAEIRLFYFLPPGSDTPIAAGNLARLSKGKMVGVRYNKDKDWVGGSFCLFEP